MRNAPVIYIVVPCYNEEEVLPLTAEFLGKKLDDLTRSRRIHPGSRVLMVDDGSKDRTWKLIEELHEKDERFAGVKLSRNRGHQNALLAGLFEAASSLQDADIAVINGNYAIEAGLKVTDALAVESSDSLAAQTYGNVVAVREGDEESDKTKALMEVLTSDDIKEFIETKYDGAVVPLF